MTVLLFMTVLLSVAFAFFWRTRHFLVAGIAPNRPCCPRAFSRHDGGPSKLGSINVSAVELAGDSNYSRVYTE
jgi:hypothetical protein